MSDQTKKPDGGYPILLGTGDQVRVVDWSLVQKKPVSEAMTPAEFVGYYTSVYPHWAKDVGKIMARLKRTRVAVTWADANLVDFIRGNKAGEDGSELSVQELEEKYQLSEERQAIIKKATTPAKGRKARSAFNPWTGVPIDTEAPCC